MNTAGKKKPWVIARKELDNTVRPQDDFYAFVNNTWIAKNPIPSNEARWGSFMKLRHTVDTQLKTILADVEKMKAPPAGSAEQLIRDFARSGMNMKQRNALGSKPLAELFDRVRAIEHSSDITDVVAHLHLLGIGCFWAMGVEQDAKKSTRYLPHLYQDGLGMPDREYYIKNDAESVRVRTAYEQHIERLFVLLGESLASAVHSREAVLRIETSLAKASMKKEALRDPEKSYNPYAVKALPSLASHIDWKSYFALSGITSAKTCIVGQPKFFQSLDSLLAKAPVADLKTYLQFHIANSLSGALSQKFINQSFSFYGTVLSGTTVMKPLWRRVLGVVNSGLGELLGQIYVKKHFPPEAKKYMLGVVADLFTAYEARIQSLDWMTAPTKRKALLKLKALTSKIGYPDVWKSYKGLKIVPDDYVGNILAMNVFEHHRAIKKLSEPIDRKEWFMYPQTVNAYFAPTMNDIVFPAGILQLPFFDPNADDALNYGAMGAVIGHEITHGFDDEGSKYDEHGNLKVWWTKEDRKRFEAKARKVEKQFNRYTVADGLPVNGKLTLGENIADLGGLSIAYDAYQLSLARTGRHEIDGYTPEQRYFMAFALFEREHSRPEFQKMQVLNDPHSPGIFRINGPVSNFTPFYDAYDVSKGDALYRSPKDREMVW